ncbi:beta-ketoacyl synthase N-terminal-like domain-containing protein [Serratia fonticola]|uniref:beta-ketoacyl synthase N-terminal-like domain-containing protein n=1 Tax=Serratia fonticola TaxID=47917 RepID=UPI003BB4911C
MMERIVITGTASILPEKIPHLDVENATCRTTTFSSAKEMEHRRQTVVSTQLLQLCQQLFRDAGLDGVNVAGEETGLVSGAYYGCMSVTQGILTTLHQKGPRGVDAIEFAKATHSFPLSAVSIAFSLLGPAAAVVSDELASLDALMMARDWLLAGRCQRVIVAGYEHFSPLLQAHLGHLASEGHYCDNLSVVMLETQSSALARGAVIRAEVLGLRRFSGSLEKMTRQWGTELQQLGTGTEACHVLSVSSPQPAARSLEQAIGSHYSRSHHQRSEAPQVLGATAVLQLANMVQAPLAGEWVLNTFATAGGGMLHLRLDAL